MEYELTDSDVLKIKNILDQFLVHSVPKDLIDDYIDIEDFTLQDYVHCNLYKEFEWCTAIQLIESAFKIVFDAKSNGNI